MHASDTIVDCRFDCSSATWYLLRVQPLCVSATQSGYRGPSSDFHRAMRAPPAFAECCKRKSPSAASAPATRRSHSTGRDGTAGHATNGERFRRGRPVNDARIVEFEEHLVGHDADHRLPSEQLERYRAALRLCEKQRLPPLC